MDAVPCETRPDPDGFQRLLARWLDAPIMCHRVLTGHMHPVAICRHIGLVSSWWMTSACTQCLLDVVSDAGPVLGAPLHQVQIVPHSSDTQGG